MHRANLAHAGTVLSAQANDLKETKELWSGNLKCVFWLILCVIGILGMLMALALYQGNGAEVIGLITDLGGYLVAIIGGARLDRA